MCVLGLAYPLRIVLALSEIILVAGGVVAEVVVVSEGGDVRSSFSFVASAAAENLPLVGEFSQNPLPLFRVEEVPGFGAAEEVLRR